MFSYLWPVGLVVLSNILYHICSKSTPDINPFAALTVTYFVGALISLILYFVLTRDADLFREYARLNWSSVVLGIVIVGLEAGYIFAYKAGWSVSSAQIVQSAVLAIFLIVVGKVYFHEAITWNKLVGIGICLVGLYFINMK